MHAGPASHRCGCGSTPQSTRASRSSAPGRRPILPRSSIGSRPAGGRPRCGALELLGAAEGPARAAGRHLGLALGLVRLLQTLPGDLRQNPDVVARHDARPARPRAREPGRRANGRPLRPIVAELAAHAREHLEAARRYRYAVPQRGLAALLPAPLLAAYLRRLARAGFDPFAPVRIAPGGLAPLWLLGCHALGRY